MPLPQTSNICIFKNATSNLLATDLNKIIVTNPTAETCFLTMPLPVDIIKQFGVLNSFIFSVANFSEIPITLSEPQNTMLSNLQFGTNFLLNPLSLPSLPPTSKVIPPKSFQRFYGVMQQFKVLNNVLYSGVRIINNYEIYNLPLPVSQRVTFETISESAMTRTDGSEDMTYPQDALDSVNVVNSIHTRTANNNADANEKNIYIPTYDRILLRCSALFPNRMSSNPSILNAYFVIVNNTDWELNVFFPPNTILDTSILMPEKGISTNNDGLKSFKLLENNVYYALKIMIDTSKTTTDQVQYQFIETGTCFA